jgi:dihydroorotate dehydrogenase (NAD+) catalytic subunit
VHAARSATELPIVGMGGVWTGQDALELIACGATHIALGTVLFADPDAPGRVRGELLAAARRGGFAGPDDAFCTAFPTVAKAGN